MLEEQQREEVGKEGRGKEEDLGEGKGMEDILGGRGGRPHQVTNLLFHNK